MFGGLTSPIFEPAQASEIANDLVVLYKRLVDLGVEYRNGKVYLADLEDNDV